MSIPDGFDIVRSMRENAEEVNPPESNAKNDGSEKRQTRKRKSGNGGEPPDCDTPDEGSNPRLPPDCPVRPLGTDGDLLIFLDGEGQLRTRKVGELTRLWILGLFGGDDSYLQEHWPRWGEDKKNKGAFIKIGWAPELTQADLIAVATNAGRWASTDKIRGPGAWCDEDGSLVLHCGDAFWRGSNIDGSRSAQWCRPGLLGGRVYPGTAPHPRPSDQMTFDNPGREILTLLETWAWRRGELDSRLCLGWICAALVGGALKWRPALWITGDMHTGKSTLHELIRGVIGSIVSVSDTSEAGLRQEIRLSSLPVAIDELEAETDDRKADAVVKLARQASSGGVILRGGADHQGQKFVARSAFLFSSILLPSMRPQDRSRLAILDLNPLHKGIKPPKLDATQLGLIGADLRRLLADRWFLLKDRIETFWHAFATDGGHSARGADQFGTLLACADIVLSKIEPDSDSLLELISPLAADSLSEVGDNVSDHERCVSRLLSYLLDVYRNSHRHTVAEWVMWAMDESNVDHVGCRNSLRSHGMAIIEDDGHQWLAVSNNHEGVAKIFDGTHWGGRSGATGVWVQALGRVPGSKAWQLKFNGQKSRCRLLPLDGLNPILDPDPKPQRTISFNGNGYGDI